MKVTFPSEDVELCQVVAEVESCFTFSEEDKQNLWHSRNDYQFSRSSARVIAKESERYGHSKHLDGCYISSFNQEVQDSLNLWVLHGHCRRGLERWANTGHGHARKDDQYLYIQGVLRAQAEMKLKDCYSEERLREVGHILSRKSRLFAQMLGEADSHAAKWEFGMIDALPRVSPLQRRKNLGLVHTNNPNNRTVSRVPDLLASPRRAAGAARRVSESKIAPKITIRTKPGRVPRMA